MGPFARSAFGSGRSHRRETWQTSARGSCRRCARSSSDCLDRARSGASETGRKRAISRGLPGERHLRLGNRSRDRMETSRASSRPDVDLLPRLSSARLRGRRSGDRSKSFDAEPFDEADNRTPGRLARSGRCRDLAPELVPPNEHAYARPPTTKRASDGGAFVAERPRGPLEHEKPAVTVRCRTVASAAERQPSEISRRNSARVCGWTTSAICESFAKLSRTAAERQSNNHSTRQRARAGTVTVCIDRMQ